MLLNKFLLMFKFKYEDLRSLSQVLEEGHLFFTWDLRSGYHHVDICVEHQTYLAISWRFHGVSIYFTFAVSPFGLSSACFCFTKLLPPLVKRGRSMSYSSFVHLIIASVRHLKSYSGRGTLITDPIVAVGFFLVFLTRKVFSA